MVVVIYSKSAAKSWNPDSFMGIMYGRNISRFVKIAERGVLKFGMFTIYRSSMKIQLFGIREVKIISYEKLKVRLIFVSVIEIYECAIFL